MKKIEDATVINNVVLTDKAINSLEELQRNDNEYIRDIKEYVADAVCFIGRHFDEIPKDELAKVQALLTNLSFIRERFDELKRP